MDSVGGKDNFYETNYRVSIKLLLYDSLLLSVILFNKKACEVHKLSIIDDFYL